MALPASVQEFKNGTFRVLWNANNSSIKGLYQENFSSFNYSSNFELTFRDGIKECYEIKCSMATVMENDVEFCYPLLKLILMTSDKKNVKQRKLIARFLGYEKEMLISSDFEVGQDGEAFPSWTVLWLEITDVGCSHCFSNLGMTETFEILIDMDPTSLRKRGQKNVLSHIAHLWESKTLADVTFKCDDRDIKAHSLIISSGSPVFAAMFQNDFKEQQEKVAVIREIKGDVFEKLLYFIYTGEIDFEFHDIAGLLVAADMYNVEFLKEECDLYLSENVTLSEATNYLILSHLHDAEELYESTLHFMRENSEAICAKKEWMSLFMKYPELGFVAMQYMVKKNVP